MIMGKFYLRSGIKLCRLFYRHFRKIIAPSFAVRDEKGFALTETVLLSIVVVALAGTALVLQTATNARQRAAAQATAIFLGQTQAAALLEKSVADELATGALPWQGESADLTANGIAYAADTQVVAAADGAKYATITIRYTLNNKQYAEIFERIIP